MRHDEDDGSVTVMEQDHKSADARGAYPMAYDLMDEAAAKVWDLEKSLHSAGFMPKKTPTVAATFQSLLDVGAGDGVTAGVFGYLLCDAGDVSIAYFFESGNLRGFMHDKCTELLKRDERFGQSTICLLRVYSEEDTRRRSHFLQKRCSSISSKRLMHRGGSVSSSTTSQNRASQSYRNKLSQLQFQLANVKDVMETAHYSPGRQLFVHIVRTKARQNKQHHVYTYSAGLQSDFQNLLESELRRHQINGVQSYPYCESASLDILQISSGGKLSLPDQFDVLSSLSNYHWDPYIMFGSNKLSNHGVHVGYEHHYAFPYTPEGRNKPKNYPLSPRNRFVYCTINGLIADRQRLLVHALNKSFDQLDEIDINDVPVQKKSRLAERNAQDDHDLVPNQQPKLTVCDNVMENSPVFQHFTAQVVEFGILKWRQHTDTSDTFVFNDYVTDGKLSSASFAHTTQFAGVDSKSYTCSCSTFSLMQSLMLIQCDDGSVRSVSEAVTCLHCLFFKCYIDDFINSMRDESCVSESTVPIYQKLLDSQSAINYAIVPVFVSDSIYKYSVRPRIADACAIVHISRGTVACQNSECQRLLENKASTRDVAAMKAGASVCPHLEAMKEQQEAWIFNLPADSMLQEDEDQSNLSDNESDDNSNSCISVNVQSVTSSHGYHFNSELQQWDFGGLSKHRPADEKDKNLSKNIRQRQLINDRDNPRISGLLTQVQFSPPLHGTCACGAGFTNEQYPYGCLAFDYNTTLYTRHAAVKCMVNKARCMGGKCESFYSGEPDNIHFWSKDTACGDEIGWDFVNSAIKTKTTFSIFVDLKTEQYKSLHPDSVAFMSRATFVCWFFSWAAAFKLDFREDVDPWCGHSPSILACDTAHIGLPVRNLNIEAITSEDASLVVANRHTRYDRVFLPDSSYVSKEDSKKARGHLKWLCDAALSKKITGVNPLEVSNRNRLLLVVCPQDERCVKLLEAFSCKSLDTNVLRAYASFLRLLSGDAPVSAILPPRFHELVTSVLSDYERGATDGVPQLNQLCPELATCLLESAGSSADRMLTVSFVRYLMDFVAVLHASDRLSPEAVPTARSYNPEKGIAYYFTSSGARLRAMPFYDGLSSANDDCLADRQEGKKHKPTAPRAGWSDMFLWFCPIHGHCYGYHMIQGSQSQKDPFCSSFLYMERAPDEVYYDFACSLQEFCLNREPHFWKNTRFWHNLMSRGCGRKCGDAYRSQRIAALRHVKSDICKQFDAFVQCIKFTGSRLSQGHFCFFVQFFISIWQRKKTEAFTKRLNIAQAGLR